MATAKQTESPAPAFSAFQWLAAFHGDSETVEPRFLWLILSSSFTMSWQLLSFLTKALSGETKSTGPSASVQS